MKRDRRGVRRRCHAPHDRPTVLLRRLEEPLVELSAEARATKLRRDADEVDVRLASRRSATGSRSGSRRSSRPRARPRSSSPRSEERTASEATAPSRARPTTRLHAGSRARSRMAARAEWSVPSGSTLAAPRQPVHSSRPARTQVRKPVDSADEDPAADDVADHHGQQVVDQEPLYGQKLGGAGTGSAMATASPCNSSGIIGDDSESSRGFTATAVQARSAIRLLPGRPRPTPRPGR